MLDRFVRHHDNDSFPTSDPAMASLTNSRGDPFDVCLSLEKLPQPSFLYLRWLNSPKEGEPVDAPAAHDGVVWRSHRSRRPSTYGGRMAGKRVSRWMPP